MGFQETANSDSAWDLTLFADLINFANFIRNRVEFEDIMLINFATDGQDELVKILSLNQYIRDRLIKSETDSTIPIERDRAR